MTRKTENLLKRYGQIAHCFFILLGVVSILLACLLSSLNEPFGLILFTVGTAVTSSSLITLLHDRFGVDTLSLAERRFELERIYGLKKVFRIGEDPTIRGIIENAHSIDILANTARRVTDLNKHDMEKAIRKGCQIRILLSDAASPIWKVSDAQEALSPGHDTLVESQRTLKTLRERAKILKDNGVRVGSIIVKVYQFAPTAGILIVDRNVARHSPYLPFCDTDEVFIYEVEEGKLLDYYQTIFDRVWENKNVATVALEADFARQIFKGLPD